MRKFALRSLALGMVVSMLAGCGNSGGGGDNGGGSKNSAANTPALLKTDNVQQKPISTEPITLKVFSHLQKDVFDTTINSEWKEKYPNVTIDYLVESATVKLQDLIASGNPPDLVIQGTHSNLLKLLDTKLAFDMTDMVKANKIDLSKYDQVGLNNLKTYSDKGQLYAIPYDRGIPVMYYNKALFDRFGVPYPKDGMTWDEAIEVAKKVSRTEGDVIYRGLNPDASSRVASQLKLGYYDEKTGKAVVTTEGWAQFSTTWKNIFAISNNDFRKEAVAKSPASFDKDQTVAMFATGYNSTTARNFEKAEKELGLKWDMVSFPAFTKGVGPTPGGAWIAVTSASKNKERAFQLIQGLISEEKQTKMAKEGFPPVLDTPEVQKVFGENFSPLKGKNTKALFVNKGAELHKVSQYDASIGFKNINAALENIKNGMDVNTALRGASDAIEKEVAAEKAK